MVNNNQIESDKAILEQLAPNRPLPEITPDEEKILKPVPGEQERVVETKKPTPEQAQAKPQEAVPVKPSRLPNLRMIKPTIINRDQLTVKIEKIMEDGLADAFQKLSPVAKEEFKLKGEETANKIRELMNAANIKIKKVFKLLYQWLRLLPGINKFFLEQEAKIKADKIAKLKP